VLIRATSSSRRGGLLFIDFGGFKDRELWYASTKIKLSTAPQNKVTVVSKRHSGNLLAGIQKNSLDTGLRRYDELTVDSYLC
jgi:hypothetical protein